MKTIISRYHHGRRMKAVRLRKKWIVCRNLSHQNLITLPEKSPSAYFDETSFRIKLEYRTCNDYFKKKYIYNITNKKPFSFPIPSLPFHANFAQGLTVSRNSYATRRLQLNRAKHVLSLDTRRYWHLHGPYFRSFKKTFLQQKNISPVDKPNVFNELTPKPFSIVVAMSALMYVVWYFSEVLLPSTKSRLSRRVKWSNWSKVLNWSNKNIKKNNKNKKDVKKNQ